MMICKADFEELFPDLFKSEPAPAARQMAKRPSAESIARWEDDGGRNRPATPRSQAASDRRSRYDPDIPELARTGGMAATMPAVAAYAAAWTMLSGYHR